MTRAERLDAAILAAIGYGVTVDFLLSIPAVREAAALLRKSVELRVRQSLYRLMNAGRVRRSPDKLTFFRRTVAQSPRPRSVSTL